MQKQLLSTGSTWFEGIKFAEDVGANKALMKLHKNEILHEFDVGVLDYALHVKRIEKLAANDKDGQPRLVVHQYKNSKSVINKNKPLITF